VLGVSFSGPLGPAPGSGHHDLPGETGIASERDAWIVLASVEGIGSRLFARLLGTHGSARTVLQLARSGRLGRALAHEPGATVSGWSAIPGPVLAGIVEAANDPARVGEELGQRGVWTVTLLDRDYPGRLRRLPDPPPVLYGVGDPASLHAPRAVAVVGTRRPTARGRFVASRAAAQLATSGAVVVSGLAVGIDGAAHAAVVAAGRPTVAVIGSGHGNPCPVQHRALMRQILATGGSIVGELRPAAMATRGTYPRRNRIIVGLADAVLIVEAPRRSGALITAGLALEHGVPLFVVPGQAGAVPSTGCQGLLDETEAQPFESAVALLEAIGGTGREGAEAKGQEERGPEGGDAVPRRPVTEPLRPGDAWQGDADTGAWPLGVAERQIARIVAEGPITGDALVARSGLAPGVVAGVLTILQVRGLVATLGALYLPAGRLLIVAP
jgi:DNA processing protein